MDITAALDVAVGLVLMYLVLSLLCTTVNEFIASTVRLRANTLQAAMQQLIDDKQLQKVFEDHGVIDSAKVAASGGKIQRSNQTAAAVQGGDGQLPPPSKWWSKLSTNYPSYLSGKSVAQALIGAVGPDLSDPKSTVALPKFDDIANAIRALPAGTNIKDALLSSLLDAKGDLDRLHTNIATWFDNSMDRLSGAYKRYLQWISVAVGLVIAIIFNADTLHVGHELWHDRSLSQSITQSAPDIMRAACPGDTCGASAATPDPKAPIQLDAAITKFQFAENRLRGFPIGWSDPNALDDLKKDYGWLWKIIGLIITAAALAKGAPFWFDLLQKIMNFRATGDKPTKTPSPQPTT